MKKGSHVILACRNKKKCENAAAALGKEGFKKTEVLLVDLSDFESVRIAGEEVLAKHNRLDHLILNAGLMTDPPLWHTQDGIEMQFAINHLGHFALTSILLPLLAQTDGSRVVPVSSIGHRYSKGINFDDVLARKDELPSEILGVYADTKLSNLLFARELQRRLKNAGKSSPTIVPAHPGFTHTELQRHSGLFDNLGAIIGMSPEQGALSEVRAAVDTALSPLDYIGPSGVLNFRGFPSKNSMTSYAKDDQAAKKLWELSERVLGDLFVFPF